MIFSDNSSKPSLKYRSRGHGGFCHNEQLYLRPLLCLSKLLNRKVVFPQPSTSLTACHNIEGKKIENTTWNDYLDIDNIHNLEKNPPFSFNENGSIKADLSIAYYPSNTPINKMDNEVDIIALVHYNDNISGLRTDSFLSLRSKNIFKLIYFYSNYLLLKRIPTSKKLKCYADEIISKLTDFAFIHIRRGDYLYLNVFWACPPHGSVTCTSPEFVSKFIKQNIKQKTIIVATNEKDLNYKHKLVKLLDNYNIIFEDELLNNLPPDVLNNNYYIYLILHEIAKKANINIGTAGYVRLGNKYDFRLTNYQKGLTYTQKLMNKVINLGQDIRY